MTYLTATDYFNEAASGRINGVRTVNKFGYATNIDSGVQTDIWSRANPTDDQDVWAAPTTARTHDITSDSASDDDGSTGTNTLRIWGLTAWNAAEVTEDVTMNGTANVATANAYVIIHRMKALTWGSAGPNVGQITATAQTDGTVTAQIEDGEGQTQMAIFGVPSTDTAKVFHVGGRVLEGNTPEIIVDLLVNEYPDNELAGFINKGRYMIRFDAPLDRDFRVPPVIAGPAIVKVQMSSDTANTHASAEFDLVLETN